MRTAQQMIATGQEYAASLDAAFHGFPDVDAFLDSLARQAEAARPKTAGAIRRGIAPLLASSFNERATFRWVASAPQFGGDAVARPDRQRVLCLTCHQVYVGYSMCPRCCGDAEKR